MAEMILPRYAAPKFVIGDSVQINASRTFDGMIRAVQMDSFHSNWRYTVVVYDDTYASMTVDEANLTLSVSNGSLDRAQRAMQDDERNHRLRLPKP